MDNQIVAQLGADLIEATARNGASIISDKIRTAKTNKEYKETISELEEIIYDLLNDKAEIQRIAQAYEQELVAQKITEDDIKYITNNLIPILSSLLSEENREQLEQLKKLLSVETLTIMQLIGFNYKQAIGEPLTLLLRKIIEAKIPMDPKTNVNYALAMANIAKDKEATMRFYHLTNQEVPED
mgnify:FL=1